MGTTSKKIAELVAIFATTKNPKDIISLIGQVAGKLDPLMRECSNPICVNGSIKRCENDNG